ncbi:hypothetical protein MUCCIDRAFT_104840 [Mucor lusitanicus CBS 277.49]|uniref:Uncharacterized protein n=1 Tax=Mucor lusitanicus CBS 277.49 TaxID=747725 RepID=A0A162R381_MUCCL|nr:hypothetical protein MUCCIDRAFT_104837 [Mucor lusitanicus CBS 277.49]OAD07890.1 hypothetical protein MUCCIDRAFT_104840 [Mucor lusitanicus CBS 277.49]
MAIVCPPASPSVVHIPASIRSVMAFNEAEQRAALASQVFPFVPDTSSSHWTVSTGPRSHSTIAQIKLGALRRSWHPSVNLLRGSVHPPLLRPFHLRLPPHLWRVFWSLTMAAKAFTPW